MKKTIGAIFSVGGLIALIYTTIEYMNDTGSVSIGGAEVAESTGSIMPIIISGVVILIGVVILMTSKGE